MYTYLRGYRCIHGLPKRTLDSSGVFPSRSAFPRLRSTVPVIAQALAGHGSRTRPARLPPRPLPPPADSPLMGKNIFL